MKLKLFIKIILLLSLFGCDTNPNTFKYKTNLMEGLKLAKEQDKPVFLHFTCYGCMGYDEFAIDFVSSKSILQKLNNDYVSVLLRIDDQSPIEASDTLGLSRIGFAAQGKVQKSKNKGELYAAIEWELFENKSQPLYALLNPKGQLIIEPFEYTGRNKKQFFSNLEEGIKYFKNNETKLLETDTVTIDLEYMGMMCDCLQWITPANKRIYEESMGLGATIAEDSLFLRIVPANSKTINPFEFTNEETKDYFFTFKGQFYEGKHQWMSEEQVEYNTRLFRYYDVKKNLSRNTIEKE